MPVDRLAEATSSFTTQGMDHHCGMSGRGNNSHAEKWLISISMCNVNIRCTIALGWCYLNINDRVSLSCETRYWERFLRANTIKQAKDIQCNYKEGRLDKLGV